MGAKCALCTVRAVPCSEQFGIGCLLHLRCSPASAGCGYNSVCLAGLQGFSVVVVLLGLACAVKRKNAHD